MRRQPPPRSGRLVSWSWTPACVSSLLQPRGSPSRSVRRTAGAAAWLMSQSIPQGGVFFRCAAANTGRGERQRRYPYLLCSLGYWGKVRGRYVPDTYSAERSHVSGSAFPRIRVSVPTYPGPASAGPRRCVPRRGRRAPGRSRRPLPCRPAPPGRASGAYGDRCPGRHRRQAAPGHPGRARAGVRPPGCQQRAVRAHKSGHQVAGFYARTTGGGAGVPFDFHRWAVRGGPHAAHRTAPGSHMRPSRAIAACLREHRDR